MQAPKKCESRGTLLAVNMVAGEPTEIIILMLIVSASYGKSRFFFLKGHSSLLYISLPLFT